MVSVAGIKINRGSGSEDTGSKIDKAMLKELKGMNALFARATKLGQSGLGGSNGGMGGLTTGLIRTAVGEALAVAGIGYGAIDAGSQVLNRLENTDDYRDESWKTNGTDVSRVNTDTGEVLETIDKQEAIERGILDKRGELLDIYETSNKTQDEFLNEMEASWTDTSTLWGKIVVGTRNIVKNIFNLNSNIQSFSDAVKEAEDALRQKAKKKLKTDFGLDADLDLGANARSPFTKVGLNSGGGMDVSSIVANTKVRD